MEEVIKKIIEIEDVAKEIMDVTLAEKEQNEKEHKDELIKLEEKLISDAQRKVRQIREREFLEIKAAEEAKVKRCDEQIIAMDHNAAKMMDTWVNELVKRVLS
jgi:hypothetical protein